MEMYHMLRCLKKYWVDVGDVVMSQLVDAD